MVLDVKVGDEVRVFNVHGRRSGQFEDGYPGVVTKVGRKLFTVDIRNGWDTRVFRLETGEWNNKDWCGHVWVKTLEQVEKDKVRREVIQKLRDHGVDLVRQDHSLSIEVLQGMLEQIESWKSWKGEA